MSDDAFEPVIRTSGVLRCMECGKCTAICPIARYDGGFSPRATIARALVRRDEELLHDDRLWTCIHCFQCSEVCPADVDYSALTRALRVQARQRGQAAVCTHGETIHTWMRMMTQPELKQHRLGWLSPDLQVEISESQSSDEPSGPRPAPGTLFFVGCAPYYDALFAPLGVHGTATAVAGVRILNALGIEPQVLAEERCCGHDLLWEGDLDRFLQLARLNAAMIRASGVKRIVSACPECVRTLKIDYPAHGIDLQAQVLHLSEMLAHSELKTAGSTPRRVTFHDPCRLGRHLGIYDPPRRVLEQSGYPVIEMRRHRAHALCCGTNGWTHCSAVNRAIQVERLREAKATGAEALVTACLKCQIHLRCALTDSQMKEELGIEIVDWTELVAARI
jgi:heterodisulfide reductase subunit D